MKKRTAEIFVLIILLFCINTLHAQQQIKLKNPSFEGEPQVSALPGGWLSRGTPGYSDPDTQPNDTFEVSTTAKHGKTYIGMVTRGDNSYEAVTQKLESPLKAGETYRFTCYLARSSSYLSGTRENKTLKQQHNKPIRLRILGANALRGDSTRLDQTPAIRHEKWKKHTFELTPKKDYTYIVFEAYYAQPTLFGYIGNVLVDKCSPIECVSCEKKTSKPKTPPNPPQNIVIETPPPVAPPQPIPPDTNEPENNPSNTNETDIEDGSELVNDPPPIVEPINTTALIQRVIDSLSKTVHFEQSSAKLTESAMYPLSGIYDILHDNPDLIIEVGGHTNLRGGFTYSRDLSILRADAVRNYLIQTGVDEKRLTSKGYGNTQPLINSTSDKANKANQRVEIKIISIEK